MFDKFPIQTDLHHYRNFLMKTGLETEEVTARRTLMKSENIIFRRMSVAYDYMIL